MMKQDRLIYVNSYLDRRVDDLDTSDWTTFLKESIKFRGQNKVKIAVENIEIPNTAYNFGPSEFIFYFQTLNPPSNTVYGIQIATNRVFNNGDDFVSYINPVLTAGGYNIQFSYSNTTHKLTITNNYLVPIRLVSSFRFSDPLTGPSDAMDKLGFSDNYIGTSISAGATYTAPSILKLLRTNCYYLTCNIASANYTESLVPNPYYAGDDIIGRITCAPFGTLSQLEYASTKSFYVSDNQEINSISFKLLDENLNPISLNNLPITFSVKIYVSIE